MRVKLGHAGEEPHRARHRLAPGDPRRIPQRAEREADSHAPVVLAARRQHDGLVGHAGHQQHERDGAELRR
jgi:hypothetical protein